MLQGELMTGSRKPATHAIYMPAASRLMKRPRTSFDPHEAERY